jgi:DNA invertase Pin-like site-specific DNA recombinase
LVATFTEVETGKGSAPLKKRPHLASALELRKKKKATLLIAKLDRLARNVHFVTGLIESGVEFVAADMPQANKVMIQMHAVMSEWERDQISTRTKAALAMARARGKKLGNPRLAATVNNTLVADANSYAQKLGATLRTFQQAGLTQVQMLERLQESGTPTAKGGRWHLTQLRRVLQRLSA